MIYRKLGKTGIEVSHASACVQCGASEKRCPFDVPVREKMKLAAALFGE